MSSKGCVLDLRMRDKQGTTATDYSRYGNDGALTGCKWVEKGLEFNGSSDYVNCGNDGMIGVNGVLTISAWTKTSETTANALMGWSVANDYPSIRLPHTSSKSLLYLGSGNYRYFKNEPVNITNGEWHHIVVIIAGNGQNDIDNSKMYADGCEQTGETPTKTGAIDTSTIMMVGRARNNVFFTGSISEVRIYNRALTQLEIKAYYDATKHRYK